MPVVKGKTITFTLDELGMRDAAKIEEGRKLAKAEIDPPPVGYEINVAVRKKDHRGTNYQHLFATHERSIKTAEQASVLLALLHERFPAPEYNVTIIAKYAYSKTINP